MSLSSSLCLSLIIHSTPPHPLHPHHNHHPPPWPPIHTHTDLSADLGLVSRMRVKWVKGRLMADKAAKHALSPATWKQSRRWFISVRVERHQLLATTEVSSTLKWHSWICELQNFCQDATWRNMALIATPGGRQSWLEYFNWNGFNQGSYDVPTDGFSTSNGIQCKIQLCVCVCVVCQLIVAWLLHSAASPTLSASPFLLKWRCIGWRANVDDAELVYDVEHVYDVSRS